MSVIYSSIPISFCWDNEDPRLIAVETRRVNHSNDKIPLTSMGKMGPKNPSPTHSIANTNTEPESQIVILFPTNDLRNVIKPIEHLDLEFGEEFIDFYTPFVVSSKFIRFFCL